jgi:hypothetical protein
VEIVSTEEGMQIDWSEWHEANADSPRIRIRQGPSNIKFERFLQYLKQQSGMLSIVDGIPID